jgi:hypothetical protein
MNRNIEAAGTGFSSPLIDSGGLTAAALILGAGIVPDARPF